MKRRAFIGLGLSVVLLGPEAAARASADDWDRIGHAWGYEIATAPDRSALLASASCFLACVADTTRLDFVSIRAEHGSHLLIRLWDSRARLTRVGEAANEYRAAEEHESFGEPCLPLSFQAGNARH